MIECDCGALLRDHEAYVEHVRDGMPPFARRSKPDFRAQAQERESLSDYIARHRVKREFDDEPAHAITR